jgi:hypothetical protein
MYVNVAALKETLPHEQRVALVPDSAGKLIKLGAKLHMQSGAGEASNLPNAAFKDVVFMEDRHSMVRDADVVLAVQPPALDVIDAMKADVILISFVYGDKQPALGGQARPGQGLRGHRECAVLRRQLQHGLRRRRCRACQDDRVSTRTGHESRRLIGWPRRLPPIQQ